MTIVELARPLYEAVKDHARGDVREDLDLYVTEEEGLAVLIALWVAPEEGVDLPIELLDEIPVESSAFTDEDRRVIAQLRLRAGEVT